MNTVESTTAGLPVAEQRQTAIEEAVDRVREIETSRGVNHGALEEIRNVLRELAARRELFPREHFPIVRDEHGHSPIYVLSEDVDKRFALYMSTSQGAKKVPPHNHTTWAVIVGVEGEEYNTFYERMDRGTEEGEAYLRVVGQTVVRPGTGVYMMPEDIHHIETYDKEVTLHLHMYGLALDRLDKRVLYDLEAGTWRYFTDRQNIVPMP